MHFMPFLFIEKMVNYLIDIKTLRRYFAADAVYVTQHTAKRFRERGIRMKDIKAAIADGCIIEQYENDTPFPSCLVCGPSTLGNALHVVISDEGTASSIITCYFPDPTLWDNNFTTRKKKG